MSVNILGHGVSQYLVFVQLNIGTVGPHLHFHYECEKCARSATVAGMESGAEVFKVGTFKVGTEEDGVRILQLAI